MHPADKASIDRLFVMFLLYLDESDNADRFILAGHAVFERQAYWLEQDVRQIASALNPEDPLGVEFHAQWIHSGKEKWRSRPKTERYEILKNVLGVLSNSDRSVCFGCIVEKEGKSLDDCLAVAYEQVSLRFDSYLKKLYHQNNQPERGLIIFDESKYRKLIRSLTRSYQSRGTKWAKLSNLAEVPLFLESHESAIMQLADHVAYALQRYYSANELEYLQTIMHCFEADDSQIHGLVHMSENFRQCECVACSSRR